MARIAKKLSQFTKKEIDELFKQAQRVIKHPGIHILLSPQHDNLGKILIIASRKVGNAPTRNKIKRQLKTIFYEEQLYERGYECIIIVKKEGTTISFTQLKQLLIQAFEQIKQQS